jgi:hypothetical protein
MSYYKKQLKRLARVRKLLNQTRNQLREMYDEGLTHVTFHTGTRTLSLPFDQEATGAATSAYHEVLSNQRKALKQEGYEVQQQWEGWRKAKQQDKDFLSDAKLAQGHGKPPVTYPSSRK